MNNNVIKYKIRRYTIDDADQIGEFDKLAELAYRYNPDFLPDNILCAVNTDGEILGVGHLEPHNTWHLIGKVNVPGDFIYRLKLDVSINPNLTSPDNLREVLIKRLIERTKEIKKQCPDKMIRVIVWLSSDDYEEIDFFISQRFVAYDTNLIMKYDLSKDIPTVPKPDGVTVLHNKMESEEELQQYHDAESTAFLGVVWSLNYVRWMKNDPTWVDFSAFYGNKLVGNTMTWTISDERSATEDIFVLADWRNKGIAKYVVTESLKYLKKQGKTVATLSVYGNNRPAISLYWSLGYRTFGVNMEFGYDL